nr:golgin subfamily A member 6-like protein 22 [Ipomoea batatas]
MLNPFRLQASSLMVECTQTQPKLSTNLIPSSLRNNSPSLCFSVSFNGRDLNGACYRSISLGQISIRCQAKWNAIGFSEEQSSTVELPDDDCKDDEELQRRKKVGHGNKGKVPWNKGITHSAETREKISLRTREALSDPKIRKKMSECPRSLSKQTKMRIGTSQRKLWGERLKWIRSREKFLQSWAESIADAAKKGGADQGELEWDSYEKIKREIYLQQIQRAAEKAKAKEQARLRAERAAQAKIEKMARLAQRKKEREERAKLREEIKRRRRRAKQEREELAIARESKLKARLMKIQKKKSITSHVSHQHERAWEKLDIEFMQRENIKKEVSLEDQLLLAKKKRSESLNVNVLTVLPSHSAERSPSVNSVPEQFVHIGMQI